jgi:uncharacterized protein (TIGR03067 family)
MSLSVMIAVAAVLFVAQDPTKAPAARELDKLQGTWVMVGAEEKDGALTPQEVKQEDWTLVVKGDTLTWLRRGKVAQRWTVRLDPKKQPATMDLISPDGSGTNHAVYSLTGDKWILCVSKKFKPNEPKHRPKKLTTKKGGDQPGMVLCTFERQKKQ